MLLAFTKLKTSINIFFRCFCVFVSSSFQVPFSRAVVLFFLVFLCFERLGRPASCTGSGTCTFSRPARTAGAPRSSRTTPCPQPRGLFPPRWRRRRSCFTTSRSRCRKRFSFVFFYKIHSNFHVCHYHRMIFCDNTHDAEPKHCRQEPTAGV